MPKNENWDGKGAPPSREAAVRWLIQTHGFTKADAEKAVRKSGGKTVQGSDARRAVDERKDRGPIIPSISANDIPTVGEVIGALPDLADRLLPGNVPAPRGGAPSAKPTAASTSDDSTAPATPGGLADEMPPTSGGMDRGAPLWPFEVPEGMALTVEDQSRVGDSGLPRWGPFGGQAGGRIGARYYKADSLAPLNWTKERRAALQRELLKLGLYGDRKTRIGEWTVADQDAFTAVLEASNVSGRRWNETLQLWRIEGVPEDLRGGGVQRPTFQVTNPADITATGADVAMRMTGRGTREFGEGLVSGYQAAEAAAQQAVAGDQASGGGGVIVQAPSLQTFAEDQLREQRPVEVNAYATLGAFNAMLQELGLAG